MGGRREIDGGRQGDRLTLHVPFSPDDVVQSHFVLDREVHSSERLPFW